MIKYSDIQVVEDKLKVIPVRAFLSFSFRCMGVNSCGYVIKIAGIPCSGLSMINVKNLVDIPCSSGKRSCGSLIIIVTILQTFRVRRLVVSAPAAPGWWAEALVAP